eukprot:gene33439-58033_t
MGQGIGDAATRRLLNTVYEHGHVKFLRLSDPFTDTAVRHAVDVLRCHPDVRTTLQLSWSGSRLRLAVARVPWDDGWDARDRVGMLRTSLSDTAQQCVSDTAALSLPERMQLVRVLERTGRTEALLLRLCLLRAEAASALPADIVELV